MACGEREKICLFLKNVVFFIFGKFSLRINLLMLQKKKWQKSVSTKFNNFDKKRDDIVNLAITLR